MFKKLRIISLISVTSLLAYFQIFNYWFSQDDFIHLSASRIHSLPQFLNFFNPLAQFPAIYFYRPLATQTFFFLNDTLFGLNPIPYHIEALTFHIINSYLFYILTIKIFKNPKLAFLSSILYSLSSIHFLSLFYISAFQQIVHTFFIFLSINLFINFRQNHKKKFLTYSVLAYIGALLSKESSIILPLLLIPIELYRNNSQKILPDTKKLLTTLIPFFTITIIYLLIRFLGIQSIVTQGDYSLTLNPANILQNLKWLTLWTLGLPEIITTYPSIGPSSIIQFAKDYSYSPIILITFFILTITLLTSIRKQHLSFIIYSKKSFAYNLSFAFIALLPIIFLKSHLYPHYLDLPYLFILPTIITLFLKFPKYLIYLLITIFIILQITSIQLTIKTHWTTHRSEVAQYYYQTLQQKINSTTQPSTLIFTAPQPQLDQLSITLAQDFAPKVMFPGKIKSVEYLTDPSTYQSPNKIIQNITKF